MNRILIYVDLLGFKDRVKTLPIDSVVRMLKDFLYTVWTGAVRHAIRSGAPIEDLARLRDHGSDGPSFGVVVDEQRKHTGLSILLMSDSLVLYSDPVTVDGPAFSQQLTSAVAVGRTVMLNLFNLQLPARGGISLGEFYADPLNSIFCGKALVEAYEVAESARAAAERRWNVLRPDWDVIRYDVPFKECTQQRWAVNWSSAWNAGGPVREDFFEEQMTGNDSVDRKYRNTLAYFQWFYNRLGRLGGGRAQ